MKVENMSKRKKVAAIEWRMDQDYWHKLSPEEKKWLATFNANYYKADFTKNENVLPEDKAAKKAAYTAKNVARRDLVTKTAEQVEAVRKPTRARSKGNPYGPGDYLKTPSGSVEDDLIEYLDDKHNYRFTN
jgi:hypothetical protein